MRWSRVAAASAFSSSSPSSGTASSISSSSGARTNPAAAAPDRSPILRPAFARPHGGSLSSVRLGYSRFARAGSLREGVAYGFFLGLFAATLVDLNQYLLYPLLHARLGVVRRRCAGVHALRRRSLRFFPLRRS